MIDSQIYADDTYLLLDNLGIFYLVTQVANGYTQQDIMYLHDISLNILNAFLQDNQMTWYDIINQADILRIDIYDKKHNIQELLNQGLTIHQIQKDIGCTSENFTKYRHKNNIVKEHQIKNRRSTNTGVRHVSLLSNGVYQYRKTINNSYHIRRKNFLELMKVVKERNLEWIIDDENKYLSILNDKYHLSIEPSKNQSKTSESE